MDFQLTDDQRALRAGVRDILSRHADRAALRAYVDGPPKEAAGRPPGAAGPEGPEGLEGPAGPAGPVGAASGAVGPVSGVAGETSGAIGEASGAVGRWWRELGVAGFFGLRLPEADGGVGLALPEAVLAFEETGRFLLPGPLVATHLAAPLVPGAARGDTVVTAYDPGSTRGRLVEHLTASDAVLVLDDATVRVLPAQELARSARPLRSLDPATPLHRVAAPSATGRRTGAGAGGGVGAEAGAADGGEAAGGCSAPTAAVLRREAVLLTAAQQLGSAARTVETAVEHARRRRQFGRPIGAFQAVQHRCARMLVRVELARAAVYAAAVTADPTEVAAAKLLADEAAVRNARDCLQVHGGMGFTWESDVHLHLKRAWLRASRWTTAAEAEEELARALLTDG
ncbi:acyl-CoA dehydrogenase family protein [Streptomyces sp. LX-29]|uniref:acyl-CoA dehydrogenase family protein n=1 Tax=Streptomyces sp. LX-29 TaxID=2900152 RepID=UPI00240CFAF1|nr:acyl-CoA dehydrogenase family protein [Streptomyces sp. LX-29]WFB07875.1 acyl-CoA dehydrogenase family protein [Streptomyces sp. LX-29]